MSKIVIKQKDLIGDLKGVPSCVVKMMLEEQVRQGNELDITVFQKNLLSGRVNKGFDWNKTIQGYEYWRKILSNRDFSEVNEEDLKISEIGVLEGDLSGVDRRIVLKMLNNQKKQGNLEDITVFEKCRTATKELGGFNWDETEEGFEFWDEVLTGKKSSHTENIGEMKSIVTLENGEKYLVFAGIALKLEGIIRSEEWIKSQKIIKKEDL